MSKTLAETWNGKTWAIRKTPNAGTAGSLFDAVLCTSNRACTAVGYYDLDGPSAALVERWNSAGWKIQTTPHLAGGGLDAVACSSARRCTAVGYTGSSTLALRWNGTTWFVQATPPRSFGGLSAVSCPSTSACRAVGTYDDNPGGAANDVTLAESWNGRRWAAQNATSPSGAFAAMLGGVSCSTASLCTAVGVVDENLTSSVLVETLRAGRWRTQAAPDGKGTSLAGVSCSSARACSAVGFVGDSTLAERRTTTWAVQRTRNPAADDRLLAVSCAPRAAVACTAVGEASTGTTNLPLVERLKGSTWTLQSVPI